MAKLYKTTADRSSINYNSGAELLLENLEVAESLIKRGTGLLGRKNLDPGEALWIK